MKNHSDNKKCENDEIFVYDKNGSCQVATGIIGNGKGSYLVGKRDKSQGSGYWEFLGGKIEKGESISQALRRELSEELGWPGSVFGNIPEQIVMPKIITPDGRFTLNILECLIGGDIKSLEESMVITAHSEVRWVLAGEMSQMQFLRSNIAIVEFLQKRENSSP